MSVSTRLLPNCTAQGYLRGDTGAGTPFIGQWRSHVGQALVLIRASTCFLIPF